METFLNLPAVASEQGVATDHLIGYIHWLMFALFVGWLGYFVFALVRFNRKRNPKGDYQGVKTHASSYVELTVAGIEAVLLIFVALPLWARHAAKFPEEKDSTVIQVVAQQFAWNFRYPGPDGAFGRQDMKLVSADNMFGVDTNDIAGKDDVQALNEIHVPIDKPVIVYVGSKDVIHSFRLMSMRVTQDAIPGMRIPIWFKPVKEGRYQIHCAQLCGNGHASMADGRLVVESQDKYEKWLASKAGAATSFD